MSILDEAWASVPDVVRLEKVKADVDAKKEAFGAYDLPERARDQSIDDAVRAAIESGKWPADAGRKAAKAYREAVERQSAGLALWEAARRLDEAVRCARVDNAEDALAFLGERLRDFMEEAQAAAADLGGVISADGAIAKGGKALDAWRTLTALLGVLRDIRAAQRSVLVPTGDAGRYGALQRAGHNEVKGMDANNIPDWAADAMRAQEFTVPYLVWLANSGAAWVPTSFSDLEAEAAVAADVGISDGPVTDLSPMVVPVPDAPAAKAFPHSKGLHLDHSQPPGPKPTPNATVPDPAPPTYRY